MLTPRAFCETDRTDIANSLADLPGRARQLQAAVGDPVKGTVSIRVPFGPKLPIRADADALLRLVVDVAVSWHSRVAEVARLYPADLDYARKHALTQGPDIVKHSVSVLKASTHLDVMLGLPAAWMTRPSPLIDAMPDAGMPARYITTAARERVELDGTWAGNEIVKAHYLARAAVGDTDPKPERLHGVPCRRQSCDAFALRRAPMPLKDDDPVYWSRCDRCGDLMTEPEYRQWVRRYAIYADTGVLPDE